MSDSNGRLLIRMLLFSLLSMNVEDSKIQTVWTVLFIQRQCFLYIFICSLLFCLIFFHESRPWWFQTQPMHDISNNNTHVFNTKGRSVFAGYIRRPTSLSYVLNAQRSLISTHRYTTYIKLYGISYLSSDNQSAFITLLLKQIFIFIIDNCVQVIQDGNSSSKNMLIIFMHTFTLKNA